MQQQRYYNNPYRPPHRRSFIARILPWVLILLVVVLLALFGIKALRDSRVAQEIAPYEGVFADNIHIDGINVSAMTPQEAYDAVYEQRQKSVSGWNLGLSYKGHTYVSVNYQTLGLDVNEDSINQVLKNAWDLTHTGDAYQKKEAIERLKLEAYQVSSVQNSEFTSAQLENYLSTIASYIDGLSKPSDAVLLRFDPNLPDPFVIQKEQVGYHLDIETAKQQILELAASGTSGNFELQPEVIYPGVTEADLRKNMQLRSVAQTEISTRSEYNRTQNIIVSASKISGTVLQPGREFSFNQIAQDRTEKNGYLPAEEQAYGQYVTGIGGGVCQTSTTIYQAALLGNLQISKRRTHSDPVLYTDPGLDATVYKSRDYEIDFKFKNNTSHDLYISVRVKPGASSRKQVVEVKMYGVPLSDSAQYKLKTITTETLLPPPEPEYVNDRKLYTDEEYVKTTAKEGSVVDTYLQKYINGHLVAEEKVATSTYKARQEVIVRGTKNR